MSSSSQDEPQLAGLPLRGGDLSQGVHVKFGIVTVSDRASTGVYEDKSGPAILQFFHEAIASGCGRGRRGNGWRTDLPLSLSTVPCHSPFSCPITRRWQAEYRCIADERPLIESTLCELVDGAGCSFVVTTGGTGPAPRDVTPEATEAVCERMMPGYGEQMRAISLRFVPTAVLSRQTAGLRGKALLLNLPGKPKAIRETIDEIFVSVPACIRLLGGPDILTHDAVVKAFRMPADSVPSKP